MRIFRSLISFVLFPFRWIKIQAYPWINPDMRSRALALKTTWKHRGQGYYSIHGNGKVCVLAYIAIPKTHQDVGKSYWDLDVDVSGGLTFSRNNIFGWDYGHHDDNFITSRIGPPIDIATALEFFRSKQ